LITTRSLTKRFGTVTAVSSVDLEVREGDRYGLLGPNGSGKTTLVRMLLGLVYATSGEIEVMGGRIPKHAGRILRDVGALVEEPAAYPNLSGRANLRLLDAAGPRSDRRTRRRRIGEALEQVGLAGVDGRPVRAYSLGMRQRLGLAGALVRRPRLLILDEPGNGLDPHGIRDTRQLLLDLNADGVTIFLSSHLLAEVANTADDAVIINRGRLVRAGTVRELLRPGGVAVVARNAAALATALTEAGVTVERTGHEALLVHGADAPTIAAAAVRAGALVTGLQEQSEDLESVFQELVHATGSSNSTPPASGPPVARQAGPADYREVSS
jgi:ABC-2 type transport system ATP-binding protein